MSFRTTEGGTHFMDSTVHPDRFGITEETFVLKQKASTSIQRGTTGRSEMPVFPSSTHHKVKPLPGPPHRQLASHQHKCSLETAVLGPQTAQESFPGDCLNRIQRGSKVPTRFPAKRLHLVCGCWRLSGIGQVQTHCLPSASIPGAPSLLGTCRSSGCMRTPCCLDECCPMPFSPDLSHLPKVSYMTKGTVQHSGGPSA
ncbi:uncharacterized protein LOC105240312 isoform X2 [Ailuropoda melanoleuca]|uniref:uncharacterized protein LOC105240312 isoform X2 n=1 Tax=Ailuropoda melanoleuca TaxID=9646 RepID=UPI0014947102|nr:uncharacterized protein LOC105240312 isoform X2 [Ailuropoda melanoleuca]